MSCSCALEYRSEVANFASTSFNTCSAAGTANARSERRIRLLARTENENNGCGMHNSAEYAAKRAVAAKPILKILMHSLCNMTQQSGAGAFFRLPTQQAARLGVGFFRPPPATRSRDLSVYFLRGKRVATT